MPNILKYFYGKIRQSFAFHKKISLEKKYLRLYNGAFNTEKDAVKLENRIRISVHGIEKGFSFRTTKPAFGKEKIINLLSMLSKYMSLEGHNDQFVIDSLSTVKFYLDSFKENANIKEISVAYQELAQNYIERIKPLAATLLVKKEDVDSCISGIDYEAFIATRHSYRFYVKTPVNKDLLKKALRIAEHTPTACNRQAQKVYVFTGENKDKILNIGPSRGFVSEVDTAILITVDMRAYFGDEYYQCYVDGGLYAMNLINAIHSTGLGCIPLTAGMYAVEKRQELSEKLGIPINEAPIITIGIGNRENEAQVNASYRKNFSQYTIWK